MDCKVEKGTIHFDVCGDGFPLLILHAMGTDHRSMKAWLEPIFNNIHGFKRIYIDIPAHGKSMIDDHLKSTSDMLQNILEFIDKTIPNQAFSLLGHSFGGYLAQGIFHHKRKYVKGIGLIASAIHKRERTLPDKVILERDEALLDTLSEDIRTAFETLFIYQNKENLSYFLKEIHPGRLLANRDFLTSNWREHGYFLPEEPFCDVTELQQPALVILGKQDSICGYRDYDFLLDKFPNITFNILDGAGHMLPIEKRELVQSLVKDWLDRVIPKLS